GWPGAHDHIVKVGLAIGADLVVKVLLELSDFCLRFNAVRVFGQARNTKVVGDNTQAENDDVVGVDGAICSGYLLGFAIKSLSDSLNKRDGFAHKNCR